METEYRCRDSDEFIYTVRCIPSEMSFKIRYIAIATLNSLLLLGMLFFMFREGWDVSKRLIDLDLNHKQDLTMFLAFVGILLLALIINMLLLSSRKNEVKSEELDRVLNALRDARQPN